jgi:Family of unknown function (DUF6461)
VPAEGIVWIAEAGLFELGYGVLLVRGVTEDGLSDRLGDVEVLADRMNRVDAYELELSLKDDSDDQVVRIGRAGDWAFAVAEGGPIGHPFLEVIQRVSRGTEAVSVINNGNAVVLLVHAKDGEIFGRFQLGTREVAGANTGPLTEALRHAGLIPDVNGGSAPLSVEAERSMLRVAETHFDFSLPRADILEHELMAVRVPG